MYPGVAKIYPVFRLLLKVPVVSADITISGKLFHTFTIQSNPIHVYSRQQGP